MKKIILLIIVCSLVGYGYFYYKNNIESVEKKIDTTVETVRKNSKEVNVSDLDRKAERAIHDLRSRGFNHRYMNDEVLDAPYTILKRIIIQGDKNIYTKQAYLRKGTKEHIGIFAEKANLSSIIDGDIFFFGKDLILEKDCIVKGSIYGIGDTLIKHGTVEGLVEANFKEVK